MEKSQEVINYTRIAAAIDYVQTHYQEQPSLADIAAHVHVSPDHFQRIFQEWAGTSPKKFLQYTGLQYAKRMLAEQQLSLFNTSLELGLSSTSRLHDLFIQIEGMTPAEYKNGGKNLTIYYSTYSSLFGEVLIAATDKGICYVAFDTEGDGGVPDLFDAYPQANLIAEQRDIHQNVLSFFNRDWHDLSTVKLHLRGTDFQLKVWEALLRIPMGKLTTYKEIASEIGREKSSRAVGNAIGSNPVAFLIPCHRVIQTSGLLGGYRWGITRKTALIGWEGSTLNQE